MYFNFLDPDIAFQKCLCNKDKANKNNVFVCEECGIKDVYILHIEMYAAFFSQIN